MLQRLTLSATVFLTASAGHTAETSWKALPGYSMLDLINGSEIEKVQSESSRKVDALGSAGLSWPDGRQAVSVTFRVTTQGLSWLYRCTDYYDKDMRWTGQVCYEAREAKPKSPK